MSKHLGGCYIKEMDIGTWAPQVWDVLIETYKPKNLIDVGCGAGHSTKYFISKGVDSIGVEGYLPAVEYSELGEKIITHDYTKGEYVPSEKFDLAWCCEFVEHVEEKFCNNFMKTFTQCSIVAMTHAVPGQQGYHHVNCKPASYWIQKFKNIGFTYNKDFSLQLRTLLPPTNGVYVKNTLMIFEKKL